MSKQHRINTQSSECEEYLNNRKLVTEQDQQDTDTASLLTKIQHLQQQLSQAKQKELKLKVANNQLSNMLVSSSQASQRKTIHFIAQVEDLIQEKVDKLTQHYTKKTIGLSSMNMQNRRGQKTMMNIDIQKHEKRWSNFETRSSMGQVEKTIERENRQRAMGKQNRSEAMNRMQIRERMDSIKRIERQMKQVNG